MHLLKFDSDSINGLLEKGEAGMDFSIIKGSCDHFSEDVPVAVRSNGYAMPLMQIDNIYSIVSMLKGDSLPEDELLEVSVSNMSEFLSLNTVKTPSGYLASFGAHQLLGKITLRYPTKFFRYTSKNVDNHYSNGEIIKKTYLTTFNDQQFVNSGFGAVGRYALPLPLPASYEHQYTFPVGIKLQVGTVSPLYGQAGGGVEVMTTSLVSGVRHDTSKHIDDY